MRIRDFILEDSPWGNFKRWMGPKVLSRQYDHAADTMHKIIQRKGGSSNTKHNILWYAAQIAKQYDGLDARALEKFYREKYGE